MKLRRIARILTSVSLLVLPTTTLWAQSATSGSIAGVVRDTSGAVLPGVTVEAASPALIEKIRTVVADNQGQYKIVELRPGTYTVTFTLSGFSVLKREGLELTTGFTATVNAELRVGTLEETITVSGVSPVVDTQNVRTQRVLSHQQVEALPIGKTMLSWAALALGATPGSNFQDVGGNKGEAQVGVVFRGGPNNDTQLKLDGMSYVNAALGGSGGRVFNVNQVAVQETTMETSGMTAESETGGLQVNAVPKEGGNSFKVYGTSNYTNSNMQSRNISADLRARGVTSAPSVRSIYDYGIGVGGPIKRDRLWFYTAHRWWGSSEYQPGIWFNKTVNTPFYTPDYDRPAYQEPKIRDHTTRMTWQITQKQKVAFLGTFQDFCTCYAVVNASTAPESGNHNLYRPHLAQGTWSYPLTNRLLFDGGLTFVRNLKETPLVEGTTMDTPPINDLGLGLRYNARPTGLGTAGYSMNGQTSNQVNGRVGASLVTGSHALKAGMQFYQGREDRETFVPSATSYTFRLGAPTAVTQWASPYVATNSQRSIGLFTQDQWTIRRVTLNLGLRFDYFNGWAGAIDVPAGPWVPARHFDGVRNIPNWTDLSPRLGVAYDLFGNARTAVKASLGRYVQGVGVIQITEPSNPQNLAVLSTNRTWNDNLYSVGDPRRGNYVPDCDLRNFENNGECGAIDNRRFGTVNATRRYAPDVLEGFNVRPFIWQSAIAVQQELSPRVGITVGYFRSWYGNFTVTDNLLVTPADYDPFCVTVPVDPRLPGGGGNQLCGAYDLTPGKFGLVNELVTQASHFGKRTQVYNGVEIETNARFGRSGFLAGGIVFGRTVTDSCFVVDSPQDELFCRVSPPWMAATQIKLQGAYPLPWWGIQTSATFQNLPGVPVEATNAFGNALIAPSLGRNLSGCPAPTGPCSATATLRLYESQTVFEADRLNQLDLRISKIVQVGQGRVTGMFDVYNLFNANSVLASLASYGPNWQRPSAILGARLFKVGVQFDF
jgi:hypothetical protein